MSGRASSPGHRRARLAWSRLIRPPIGRYAAPPILARPGIVAGPPSRCGKPCSWRGDGCGKSSSRGRISRKSGDFADSWKNGRPGIDGEARAEGDRTFTPREIGAFGASRRVPGPGFGAGPGLFGADYFAGRSELPGVPGIEPKDLQQSAGRGPGGAAARLCGRPGTDCRLRVGGRRSASPVSVC